MFAMLFLAGCCDIPTAQARIQRARRDVDNLRLLVLMAENPQATRDLEDKVVSVLEYGW